MSKNILAIKFQNKVKESAHSQLVTYWRDLELPLALKSKLKEAGLSKDVLSKTFCNGDSHPLKVYFTQLLIDIIYINEVLSEEDEDELFEYWEQSEFAALFLNRYSNNILETSKNVLESLETHFIDYFSLNYLSSSLSTYKIKTLPEIGDNQKWIFLQDGNALNLKQCDAFLDDDDFLTLRNTQGVTPSEPEQVIIPHENNRLILRPGTDTSLEHLDKYQIKLSKALEVLIKLTPELYKLLFNFTHTIIAINEPSMVSFSLQSLPGYSSINLSNRDFVDCIDDLIHENGHHYLNYILNSNELIIEEPDKDYFSPWRMTQRPIRGIYHGTFTFYWALNLFTELAANKRSADFFAPEELDKVRFRQVEEFYKLKYCKEPLALAKSRGLITDVGWELICEVLDLVEVKRDSVLESEALLTGEYKTSIKEMKKSLKS